MVLIFKGLRVPTSQHLSYDSNQEKSPKNMMELIKFLSSRPGKRRTRQGRVQFLKKTPYILLM